MKFPCRGVIITVVAVCFALGSYKYFEDFGRKASADTPAPEASGTAGTAGTVASVEVAPVKTQAISAAGTVFGEVVPAPDAVQVASVAYEIRVDRVMVSAGQKVSRGEPLMEVEPSPDTILQLRQAETSYDISKRNLKHVKELFDLKLATNTQMLKAQEDFRKASLALQNFKKMGVDGKRMIRAVADGLVSNVNVQDGAIVADGKPLAGTIAQNRLEVRLGVEPNDAGRLAPGQPVLLFPVNLQTPKEITGRIRKISRSVNQATRLVDVFVALPSSESAGFLLGEYIMGKIQTASSYGMVVPRSAVLPEGGNYVLYTVSGGKAVKHAVQRGIESGNLAQVSGGGLKPGDQVVVTGNYELKDGMAVKVLQAK